MYLTPFDILQEFNNKERIQIECTEITLTQLGENKNPQKYHGHGIIGLNYDEKFELICFPKTKNCSPFTDSLKRRELIKPFRIIGREYYFSLEATDTFGNIYYSKQVDVGGDEGKNGVIIKGTFDKLFCNNPFNMGNHFSIQLKNKLKLSTNHLYSDNHSHQKTPSTKLLIHGLEFIFYDTKEITKVDISIYDKRFRYDFTDIDFFLDLIRIISGTNTHFSSVNITTDEESFMMIKSDNLSFKYSTLMKPPILAYNPPDIEALSNFMSKLIAFQRSRKDYRINQIINRCINTSVASVHAYATVISLSVEELISIYFINSFTPNQSYLEKIIAAKNILRTTQIDNTIKNNIYSSLDYYTKPSMRKIFRKLQQENGLPKLLAENWNSLRGYIAHPSKTTKSNNELLHYADSTTMLFYWLLKELIDYKGELTDYLT